MKDVRTGECLWLEWTGSGFNKENTFFTVEHVDIEHEIVKRALASALQRDGSAISLGQGYWLVERASVTYGYAGSVDADRELTVCDVDGETREGDKVDEVLAVTWVTFDV